MGQRRGRQASGASGIGYGATSEEASPDFEVEPPPRPLVLLLDDDAVTRAALARLLVTGGFDVRVTMAPHDASERPQLAIVQVDAASAERTRALLEGPVAARLPIVVRSPDPERAAAQTAALGGRVVAACASGTSLGAVVAYARSLVEAAEPTTASPEDDGRTSRERIVPEALRRVPVLLVAREDVGWFDGDPCEAALLASIDGRADVATLAARVQSSEGDVLRMLDTLVQRCLIRLEVPVDADGAA